MAQRSLSIVNVQTFRSNIWEHFYQHSTKRFLQGHPTVINYNASICTDM